MIANCDLAKLVNDRQDIYARMLTMIMAGAGIPLAAGLCGISRKNLERYRIHGLNDLSNGVDSYYARFVTDLNFSAIIPAIDAEVAIHRKDPLEWLRSGPGRWINPEGTWQVPSKEPPPFTETPPTVGIAEDVSVNVEDEIDLMADAPTVLDLPAALTVLKESNLGYVIDAAQKTQDANRQEAMDGKSSAGHQDKTSR